MLKPEVILKMKEQLKSEQMAYSTYRWLKANTDDMYLTEALEEIMYDEFLHAKFVRNFLMEHKAYDPHECVELEKAYQDMLND